MGILSAFPAAYAGLKAPDVDYAFTYNASASSAGFPAPED